jgi:flagellar hook assembly protein FlgD
MTTTTTTNPEINADLIAENEFLQELVRQIRSQDG